MKPRVLYIASGGIEEPLIVSQVLRYLRRLNGAFETCHLITLERSRPPQTDQIRQALADDNIHWHGLASQSGLRKLNIWREIWAGARLGQKLIADHELNLIHARSFIPGNIGLRLAKKTGAKLLYDMRGFWAEEKLAKGTIKSRSVFRVAQMLERRLFDQAQRLISLTDAGKEKLRHDGIRTPIDVIPCCVDTDLFRPAAANELNPGQPALRFISVGSLGPGYLPEAVFGLFKAALEHNSEARLQLLTRSDVDKIKQVAVEQNCDLERIQIDSAGPEQVVNFLQNADVGLCMIQPSAAKLAYSPTKLAEYLACGLPVVGNAESIGDVGRILNEFQVGVTVDATDPASFAPALSQLQVLLQDPDLRQRCRATAVDHFSVGVAVQRYSDAYRQMLGET